ncbi:hypothetical protein AAFN86_17540 [Roseomonas sp. CAU 1739]|uniref:hypothetical protein n=1 Tax=Roseomonas sp. CAU 1739 TaxID=3140364 RepID=UPI00325A7252
MLARLRAYAAHPDAATRVVNAIALLVGFNGPFYPAYVWFLAPEAGPAALATMAASPFFLAIPWLARRHAAAARAALPVIGIANTVWTAALLGRGTGVDVFLFPCLVLALLCWRERWTMLGLLGAGLLAQQVLLRWAWAPIASLAMDGQVALQSLNTMSVGALLAVIALNIASLLPCQRTRAG